LSSEQYSSRYPGTQRDYLRRGRQLSEQAQFARHSSNPNGLNRNRSQRLHPMRGWTLAFFLLLLPAAALCRDQIGGWIQKGIDAVTSLRGTDALEIDYHEAADEPAELDTVDAAHLSDLAASFPAEAVPQPWTSQSPVGVVSDSEPIPEDSARRLEQLGVESGKLLRWGGNAGYWRYSCRVRPDADAAMTHEFEAVGTTAAEALSAAESKITGWRQERIAQMRQAYLPGTGQVCVH